MRHRLHTWGLEVAMNSKDPLAQVVGKTNGRQSLETNVCLMYINNLFILIVNHRHVFQFISIIYELPLEIYSSFPSYMCAGYQQINTIAIQP